MTKRPTLKVSKMDAAKSQLETAIRLWFFSGDPISIHALAAPANRILHDTGKKRGIPTILRSLPGAAPKHRRRLEKMVSRYENFFKHADKDPDAVLNFNPEVTDIYILDAVFTYESLTQEVAPILATFKMWMFIQEPRFFKMAAGQKLTAELERIGIDFKGISKAEFFGQCLSLVMKNGVG